MLPIAPDHPAASSQHRVGLTVAFDIVVELPRPPVGIRRRASCVLRAAMPEAAVDEDGQSELAPRDVCTRSQIGLELNVGAETYPSRMQNLAHPDFRGSVL